MITTVTLNPSIDREYFIDEHKPMKDQYIYDNENLKVYPGGKGLIAAINLKNLGYSDVQNIGFIGGKQGLFFEKMVQDFQVTTNYVYTSQEMRNNIKIIAQNPPSNTLYNDYTYSVSERSVKELKKRFKRSIRESDLVMIAGSIPSGVSFDIYNELVEICNELDKDVYLKASGEALNRALKAEPKFVVPYFKHTHKILDVKVEELDDYIKMGRKLQKEGAQYVIMPFHTNRLLFDNDDTIYMLSPREYCIRNLLGAGDAYNAAFFDFIYQNGFDFIEANRYAAAAALDIAEHKTVFLHNREEIEKNVDNIIIEEMEV
ncbi:MAG TPA: PfkB family carbohydrate kinase [Halanaerobiales bacterium]|nr:PfkB family carbohydrate kinase [Halanaerobiales bacterium]